MGLEGAVFTVHPIDQMARRQVSQADVRQVLAQPEHVNSVRAGRVVAQAIIGQHLVRVFVDVDRNPPEIVTAYKTSQIAKYRGPP